MARVARLLTLVDLVENQIEGQVSFSARLEAVLADERRVLVLDDRGWSSSLPRTTADPGSGLPGDAPDFWAVTSVEEIEETSRWVVGPDEPFDGHSQEDMERDHWGYLAGILRQQGVAVDADELKGLPHDVVLSERVLALVGRDLDEPRGRKGPT
jgi:hypothetical protein